MFIKNDEINDQNDISLVNPDSEKKGFIDTTFDILCDSFSNMISLLLISLTDNVALIFIGKENSLHTFISLQLSLCFIYFFTLCFSAGIIEVLQTKGKIKKLYFDSLSMNAFNAVFIILPITVLSYFILPDLSFKNFILFSSPYIFLKMTVLMQIRLLEIKKLNITVTLFCLFLFILHTSLLYFLTHLYNFKGVIWALTVSYLIGSFVSHMLIRKFTKVLKGVNYIDFFKTFYASFCNCFNNFLNSLLLVVRAGISSSVYYCGFALIIFSSYFLDRTKETATNIILLNIISIPFLTCYGFSVTFNNYVAIESFMHSHHNKVKFTKICLLLVLMTACVFSSIFYFFKEDISVVYFKDELIKKNFEHIISLYSWFIFPHFASIILDGFVRYAANNGMLCFVLTGIFTFVIMPIVIIGHIWFDFTYVYYWYGFFIYLLLHLICLGLYLLVNRVVKS